MSVNKPILDEFFVDAVAEVLNIGMGNAAAALSEMIEDELSLSVPGVEFVTRSYAIKKMGEQTKSNVSGVSQRFSGAFDGDVLLLFPVEQSLELVRAVLRETIALDDLSEMEQEAMTEIGNVILNACLCSMADMFDEKMEGDIPEFIKGSLATVFEEQEQSSQADDIVLLLNMDFAIRRKNIQGYVTFLMDVKSVQLLKKQIEKLLVPD